MQGNSFTVYVWLQYSKYTAMSQFISSEIAAFTHSITSDYGKDRKSPYAITLTIKKQSARLARIKIDIERRESPEGEKYEWISNCLIGIISLVVVGAVAVNGTKPDGTPFAIFSSGVAGFLEKMVLGVMVALSCLKKLFTVKKEA